jgi:hypothetical protein
VHAGDHGDAQVESVLFQYLDAQNA